MYETTLEFLGEERPLRASFETVWGDIYLEKIEVALDFNESYTALGIYDPRVERRWLDVIRIISDRQALALMKEIKEEMKRRRADAYDDSRLQAWEERRQYANAA